MRIFVCAVVIAVLCAPVRGGEPKKDGTALFARARQLSSLTEQGRPPFRMKVGFKLFGTKAGTVDGTYDLWWLAPEKSVTEITAADYTERTIRNGASNFEIRPSAYPPLRIWQLQRLIDAVLEIRVPTSQELSFSEKRINKHRADCVAASSGGDERPMSVCFDLETGTLLARTWMAGDETSHEYADYTDFNGKTFPRSMRLVVGGRPVIEVTVESLEAAPQMDAARFEIPAGAQRWPVCNEFQPTQLKAKIPPTYPLTARQAHQQGTVIMLVTIAADGSVQDPMIGQSAGQALDQASIEAIKKWRYSPPACNGLPIKLRMEVAINYELRG